MKRMKWYKNNKGSSLLFVIISIAFVAILGTLLSQLTVINTQMKKTDRKAKETFYTNETALNELQLTLEDISGEAMKKAYVGVVNDYANITNDTSRNLQDQFAYNYVRYLVNFLAGGDYTVNVIPEITNGNDYAGLIKEEYNASYTSALIKIKNEMDTKFSASAETTEVAPSTWFKNDNTTNNTLEYVIDNSTGADSYVLLKNIQVSYNTKDDKKKQDALGEAHESTITTDIKLTVPKLSFQSGIYPKYTSYSIIANKYLNVDADNVGIDGDLYGSAGILVRGNNVNFTGPKTTNIITRGDFFTYQNADLTIQGDPTSSVNDCVRIWANNFGTAKEGIASNSPTELKLTGDAFIQDDLVLNANSSDVTLKGNNYYGFGYNRLNKRFTMMSAREKRSDMNSQYSSSITINGKNVSLDMSGVNNMKLAGRAYISRVQETTSMSGDTDENKAQYYVGERSDDIMTGEAVEIKSNNNMAYLIPGDAIAGGANPMQAETYKNLQNNGEELVDTGKLRNVRKYLAATPYTTYCYNVKNSGSYVYFYYNFKNQSMANEYFSNYFAGNESALEKKLKSSGYINNTGSGIKLSSNVGFLSAACTGNILTVKNDGDMDLVKPSTENNPDGDLTDLLEDAVKKAKEYYSMQLELSTEPNKYPIAGTADEGVEFRINGKTNEEKSQDRPIYSEVVSGEGQFNSEGAAGTAYGFEVSNQAGGIFHVKKVDMSSVDSNAAVYCIYPHDGKADKTYTINSDFFQVNGKTNMNKGIILAACNIKMAAGFKGMVISKSDITLNTVNVKLEADTQLVQQILTYGQQAVTDPKQKFAHYFGLSNAGDATDPTSVDISSYVSYSNWRNEEPEINP